VVAVKPQGDVPSHRIQNSAFVPQNEPCRLVPTAGSLFLFGRSD